MKIIGLKEAIDIPVYELLKRRGVGNKTIHETYELLRTALIKEYQAGGKLWEKHRKRRNKNV